MKMVKWGKVCAYDLCVSVLLNEDVGLKYFLNGFSERLKRSLIVNDSHAKRVQPCYCFSSLSTLSGCIAPPPTSHLPSLHNSFVNIFSLQVSVLLSLLFPFS